MSKSILVIDTPRSCGQCKLKYFNEEDEIYQCAVDNSKIAAVYIKRYDCPLNPLPEFKYLTAEDDNLYDRGWDDCLTKILGETDNE